MVIIEDLEDGLLVAGAHVVLPSVAEVHPAETERTDADCSRGRQDAVASQRAMWLWGNRKDRHDVCVRLRAWLGKGVYQIETWIGE